MNSSNVKILLLGPRMCKNDTGGVVVLFENLITNFIEEEVEFDVVDTNSKNYSSKLLMFFLVVKSIILDSRKYKLVSLHGTASDFLYFSPFFIFINLFFKKNYNLRKFAGNFDQFYESKNRLSQFFIEKLLKRSSSNHFETKKLVDYFSKFNRKTFWFPNVRPRANISSVRYSRGDTFRVIFLSQIMKEKGVNELFDALDGNMDYELVFYGPVREDAKCLPLRIESSVNCKYHGSAPNNEIYNILSKYHALILPTYYPGEGYPGILIEALMLGLPIVATDWKEIPELLGESGCLIPDPSKDSILTGLNKIKNEHERYVNLSRSRSKIFIDKKVTNEFISLTLGEV